MIRLKGSLRTCASASAAVMPASISNRGRKPAAITAVTPGSRPRTSNLFRSTRGLPTAGVSAVGRNAMAGLQLCFVRRSRVDPFDGRQHNIPFCRNKCIGLRQAALAHAVP